MARSTENLQEREEKKLQIKLKYLKLQLEATRLFYATDNTLTDEQEQLALKRLENVIGMLEVEIQDKIKSNLEKDSKDGYLAHLLGMTDKDIEHIFSTIDEVKNTLGSLQSYKNALRDAEMQGIDAQYEADRNRIERSSKNEREKKAEIEALDKQYRQRQYERDLEEFESNRDFALTMAIINTALAVTKAYADDPSWAGIAKALLIGVDGGLQVAAILAQVPPSPPAYKTGGLPQGKNAIVKVNEDGQEAIMSAGATRMFGRQLSAMNVAGGGAPLNGIAGSSSAGGVLSDYAQTQMLIQAIYDMPAPVLGLKEFNDYQGKMTKITERASV